jgi:ferrous iron transport protein B
MSLKNKSICIWRRKNNFAISIVLWFLASYGPGKNSTMPKNCNGKNLNNHWLQPNLKMQLLPKTGKLLYWSYGKTIEPAISPLGYDWKIGIAIISSFAAREVFVGTLATIYSVGGTDNEDTIKK